MKYIITLCVFAFCATITKAQKADQILGTWFNQEKTSKIEIYKKGDIYYGKLIWISKDVNPDGSKPKKDLNNPNEKLRDRRLLGMDILSGLVWDAEDNEWDDGEIYDPRNGSTYSLYVKLEDPNTLYLKGYIGFSLIGRSNLWTRAE